MKLALLDRLLALGRTGTPIALVTDIATGAQSLVTPDSTEGDLGFTPADLTRIRQALLRDQSRTLETETGQIFLEIWQKPLRLLVVGGVHIAQALVELARISGYAVTVIDPRTAFASEQRFPGTQLVNDWPDEAIKTLEPDRRTAIVTLTHDPKLDDPALTAALRSEAFYIGALGSRRTHARRRARLSEAGFDEGALARIRGPVGLAIGGVTPAEVALSIMAEITAVLHHAPLADQPGWNLKEESKLPSIAALVLAAGRSSRMGRNKLLIEIGGKSLIEFVVDAALASQAAPVLVVTGHQADKVRAKLAGRSVSFVDNPDFADGLSTSLKAGLAAVPAAADGIVVCLGDMPAVGPAVINRVIAAFNPAEGREIVAPVRGGRRGNPVLWGRRFLPELAALAGDAGAKQLIEQHADCFAGVPAEDDGVLTDIDTPEALAAFDISTVNLG